MTNIKNSTQIHSEEIQEKIESMTNKNKNEEWEEEFDNNFVDWNSPRFFAEGKTPDDLKAFIKSQRASAVREFAERLKVNFGKELHCTPHLDLTIPFKKAIELSQIEEEDHQKKTRKYAKEVIETYKNCLEKLGNE